MFFFQQRIRFWLKKYDNWRVTLLPVFERIWNQKLDKKCLDYLLAKIDCNGSIERVAGSGRPRTASAAGNVVVVDEMALSQENKPRTHRTVRQISRESGIHQSSVHRSMKAGLKLKCLKKTNAQALTAANKQSRMTRTRQLLEKYPTIMVNFIFFRYENVFTLLPLPIHRTTVFTSVSAPERRTSTKSDCFAQDRPLASQSWCQSTSRSMAALLSIVSSQESKWMENTIATTYLDRSYCQTWDGYPRTIFLCFNRMAPLHIGPATQSLTWGNRHPTSYFRQCGLRIRQIWTQLTTASLECSAGESLLLQNNWRRCTRNTSDGWCRCQPVASSSKRLFPPSPYDISLCSNFGCDAEANAQEISIYYATSFWSLFSVETDLFFKFSYRTPKLDSCATRFAWYM